MDRSFVEQNQAATDRLRTLVNRLTAEQMHLKVGADWTVSITLAHLAFWDRRVLLVLDGTERDGKLFPVEFDLIVNNALLPTWALIPPRAAARLALETAVALDRRLEAFPPALLEQVQAYNPRWVQRTLHRTTHLDELDKALSA